MDPRRATLMPNQDTLKWSLRPMVNKIPYGCSSDLVHQLHDAQIKASVVGVYQWGIFSFLPLFRVRRLVPWGAPSDVQTLCLKTVMALNSPRQVSGKMKHHAPQSPLTAPLPDTVMDPVTDDMLRARKEFYRYSWKTPLKWTPCKLECKMKNFVAFSFVGHGLECCDSSYNI
jgi:hypothetical protein